MEFWFQVGSTVCLLVLAMVFMNMGMMRTAICAFGRTSITRTGKVAFALAGILIIFVMWWWWPP
jgi:hypothetical protein